MRRAPWASLRSRLEQFRLELAWMSVALQDLTYVLYFVASNPNTGRTRGPAYVFVDRTWLAAYCRACCAAFHYSTEVVIIDTKGTLEKMVDRLPATAASTIIVSKILYLKYYGVLQDLKQRGALIVA